MISSLLLSTLALAPLGQDAHTRYELLEPGSGHFRIVYDVTATEVGATRFFNGIRAGAEISDIRVTDLATGEPLVFELVDGETARERGSQSALVEGLYLQVELGRAVPAIGGRRLRIDKTYLDPESYRIEEEGQAVIFDRSLGIRRNRIVLPSGYELVACNVPAQVLEEADERVSISFFNPFPARAPLVLRGRRLPPKHLAEEEQTVDPGHLIGTPPTASRPGPPRIEGAFPVPAKNTRDIVYFLQQPETHAFRLYHDYTESRVGTDRYLNVVRPGSSVADPEARNLDTGEELEVTTYAGKAIAEAGIDLTTPITSETQVVVIRFPKVTAGTSIRLRITETYTDAQRYGLLGPDELVWSRTFGRSMNAVVLPEGWALTACALPAAVSETEDGRIRLDLSNPRPDELATLIRARRR